MAITTPPSFPWASTPLQLPMPKLARDPGLTHEEAGRVTHEEAGRVTLYLAELADAGRRLATLRGDRAGISDAHRRAGEEDVASHAGGKEALAGPTPGLVNPGTAVGCVNCMQEISALGGLAWWRIVREPCPVCEREIW